MCKKANRVLGMIKRTFTNKSKYIMLRLYKSLVRPHLEYCVQTWSPYYQKDIDLLEKVQRRFTRMIPELSHLTYEQRLSALNLTSLETRRLRGDLIETFKIITGKEMVDRNYFFKIRESTTTRGHEFKLFKPS
jgi:ribonuclease P/MRP protein subunit RPP40